MTEVTAPPVRRRRPRLRLVVLSTILGILIVYVVADSWSGRALQAELARFDDRVNSLGYPARPTVPAQENRARLIRAAAALTIPVPRELQAPIGALMTRTTEPVKVEERIRAFAASNDAAVHLLGDFGVRHQSDWEVDGVPFLDVRTLGRAIDIKALIDLEDGHPDETARGIGRGLAVASSLQQGPGLIAQLMRIGIAAESLDVTRRLLTHAEPSQAALQELARALADSRSPDPAAFGLVHEARQMSANLDQVEAGRAWAPLGRLFRPVVRMAHTKYLRSMGVLIDAQTSPRPQRPFPIMPPAKRWSPIDVPLGLALPGLERTMMTSDDFETALGTAEIAVALRRYRLDHGNYPDDLSALAPGYLAQLPLDMSTGKPPVYERVDTGFVLKPGRSEAIPAAMLRQHEWRVSK